ncbi:MAG: hypothetical protein NXI04_17135 [Planctomycetaceae bacterium]|nr:hypothetical protein [Planctomycetaceae bacterium]
MLAAFTAGNIVVSNAPFSGGTPKLFEYDTSGNLVQEFDLEDRGLSDLPRDVLVDFNGNAQIYNGTFSPTLSTIDPTTGTEIESRTFENWGTANNLTYGGIAAFGKYVFVTDMVIANNATTDRGLVRFDITSNQAERFASDRSGMIDVAVGLDGLVYGLGPGGSPNGTDVYVYDPVTLQEVRHIEMVHQNRALAVNAQGHIFTVGGIDGIRRYDQNGQQVGETLSDGGIGGLADIDLTPDGDILIASHGGIVAFTTEALGSLTSFNTRTSNGYNFAGWVPPESEVAVEVESSVISEDGGNTTVTIRRNTPTLESLTVTLGSQPAGALSLPASVTIAAGQTDVSFTASALDDELALGDRTVTISASADGHATGGGSVVIVDDESPMLQLQITPGTVVEGGTTSLTVARNSDTTAPLTVTLTSSDVSELTMPQTVTIAAGRSTSDPITLTALHDILVDGDQTVTVKASANGHALSQAAVVVTDTDVPELSLQLPTGPIAENGGSLSATIRRNTPADTALTVQLSVSDDLRLTAPTSVTVPAGLTSSTFAVTAVDDDLVNASNAILITATASGFASDTGSVTLADDDSPQLTLLVEQESVAEGGTIFGIVRRNTPPDTPLTVMLASSDHTEASLPDTVAIAAGEFTSEPFLINGVADETVDGTVSVALSAQATDHATGQTNIDVTNSDVPTLQLTVANGILSESGGVSEVVISRNTQTSGPLTVQLSSSDSTEVSLPDSVTIAAGQSSASVTVTGQSDGVVDGNVTVDITASAVDFASGQDDVLVVDVDTPMLTITASPTAVSEDGGTFTVTISRNTDTSVAVPVALTDAPSGRITTGADVTIPVGQSSVDVTLSAIDNDDVTGDTVIDLTAAAIDIGETSVPIHILDDDLLAGDVDQDEDFDANDSFLIHLVALAGTNGQIDQSKGASPLSATEIRGEILALQRHGDVDGDGDFDANDTFLIHLIRLAGTNAQIDQSKGASPLSAAEIRDNVSQLGRTLGGSGQSARGSGQSARGSGQSARGSGQSARGSGQSAAGAPAELRRSLSEFHAEPDERTVTALTPPAPDDDIAVWDDFRDWIDRL